MLSTTQPKKGRNSTSCQPFWMIYWYQNSQHNEPDRSRKVSGAVSQIKLRKSRFSRGESSWGVGYPLVAKPCNPTGPAVLKSKRPSQKMGTVQAQATTQVSSLGAKNKTRGGLVTPLWNLASKDDYDSRKVVFLMTSVWPK